MHAMRNDNCQFPFGATSGKKKNENEFNGVERKLFLFYRHFTGYPLQVLVALRAFHCYPGYSDFFHFPLSNLESAINKSQINPSLLENRSQPRMMRSDGNKTFSNASQFFLLPFRMIRPRAAFLRTESIHLLRTIIALDEKHIAFHILAIRMCIAFRIALVAVRNNVIGNPFTQSLIENKILSQEFRWQVVFTHLTRILDDASVQLVHILESMML